MGSAGASIRCGSAPVKPLGLVQRLIPLRLRVGGINRAPSPLLAGATPWLTIMLASMLPTMPMIAAAPVLPPLGLMLLAAWVQIRPGLLPVWAGLPLGAFDDLYSGQPFGSAILLWSLTMITLEVIELRIPWRSYLIEWFTGAALVCGCLVAMLMIANMTGGDTSLAVIVPQLILATLLYPAIGSLAGVLDRFRLIPIVDLAE